MDIEELIDSLVNVLMIEWFDTFIINKNKHPIDSILVELEKEEGDSMKPKEDYGYLYDVK